MINISALEKDLIKKLTFLHLKRCNVTKKEKLDLTLSLYFLEAYSPLIKEKYFEKTLNFLQEHKNILDYIQRQCHLSSFYRQPIIYLLFFLKYNYGKLFDKYWVGEEEELEKFKEVFEKIKIKD